MAEVYFGGIGGAKKIAGGTITAAAGEFYSGYTVNISQYGFSSAPAVVVTDNTGGLYTVCARSVTATSFRIYSNANNCTVVSWIALEN